jgi:anti-sigma factor RsiW
MTEGKISDDRLQSFVDGRLGSREERRLRAWLGRRPADAVRVEAMIGDRAALRDAFPRRMDAMGEPGDALTDQLATDLTRTLRRRRRRTVTRRLAAAAALLLVGWVGHQERYVLMGVPDSVRLATVAHTLFANSQFAGRVGALPEPAMEAWLGQALGESVDIPDLSRLGLSLVSARVIDLDQGPVAQAVFENDSNDMHVSLCLAPDRAGAGSGISVVELNGLTAGYWQEGDMLVTLVGDEPEDSIMALATQIVASEGSGDAGSNGI